MKSKTSAVVHLAKEMIKDNCRDFVVFVQMDDGSWLFSRSNDTFALGASLQIDLHVREPISRRLDEEWDA